MTSTVTYTTAKQLAALREDGRRYELITGELRTMSPAGNEHGRIAISLGWRVASYVEKNQLGVTFAAETGFLIGRNPDTVRAPDFAFISRRRIDKVGPVQGYWPGAPDLLAEVVSPGDTFADVEEKTLCWLAAGTRVVWVIDPKLRTVKVHRSPSDVTELSAAATLDEPELLPGWSVVVGDLFPK